MGMDK